MSLSAESFLHESERDISSITMSTISLDSQSESHHHDMAGDAHECHLGHCAFIISEVSQQRVLINAVFSRLASYNALESVVLPIFARPPLA